MFLAEARMLFASALLNAHKLAGQRAQLAGPRSILCTDLRARKKLPAPGRQALHDGLACVRSGLLAPIDGTSWGRLNSCLIHVLSY